MRLQDRVAIVVGAGQSPGEGRATAGQRRSPPRVRAPRCCVSITTSGAPRRQWNDQEEPGHGLTLFKADVTKEFDIKVLRGRRAEALGKNRHSAQQCRRLDLGAATPSSSRSPRRTLTAAWRSTSRAASSPAKHVIPIMRQQKSGAIVNMLSIGGDHHLSLRRRQGDQGGDGLLHRTARLPSSAQVRHPRLRDLVLAR